MEVAPRPAEKMVGPPSRCRGEQRDRPGGIGPRPRRPRNGVDGAMARKIDSPPGELPAIARNFTVAIDDVEIRICSLSRLASETVREEQAKAVHRYPNVVLRRALGRDRRLFEWP